MRPVEASGTDEFLQDAGIEGSALVRDGGQKTARMGL
jgi:hypothetical protein